MHLLCPTPQAVLLLVYQDERGIYQAQTGDHPTFPSLVFLPQPNIPIQPQLVEKAESLVLQKLSPTSFEILQEIEFPISHEGALYTLYVLRLTGIDTPQETSQSNLTWKNLSDLLRDMPPAKARIAYLKVWQQMLGVGDQRIEVVPKKL